MNTYVVLIRGINVGGKNKIPMTLLKEVLQEAGFSNVSTYIASGNVFLESNKSAEKIKTEIEKLLPLKFKTDTDLIKVLVLTTKELSRVVNKKPNGFGDQPSKYHSDVIFLIDVKEDEAMKAFSPREGVDTLWKGRGVIYSQRLSSMLTKSRINKAIISPVYKSMTIRNWNTTTKLLKLIEEKEKES